MTFSMRFARIVRFASLLVISMSGAASSQVVQGAVSVGAGSATDQRGVRSNAVTFAPSLILSPDERLSASLGVSATQFASNVRALGGTGALSTKVPMGSLFALAGASSAVATHTSFNATYSSAELTPTLEATISNVTLFAGARVARGRTTVRETTTIPGGPLSAPTASARDLTTSRASTGPVFGGVLNLSGARADRAALLSYREERARIAAVNVTDRVLSGTLVNAALMISANAGLRDAPDEQLAYGSATATLGLWRLLAVQASAGSYPSNRLTGTLGGHFASVGVVLRGMRTLATADEPTAPVRGAPAVPAGAKRLSIAASSAKRVELAGDWNGWTPMLATRGADGTWYADVRLPRGEYRYAFRVDGDRWNVPEGALSVDDGFGGRSALLMVR